MMHLRFRRLLWLGGRRFVIPLLFMEFMCSQTAIKSVKKIKKKLTTRFFCHDEVNMDKLKYMKLCIMLIDKTLMTD